jgi:hypothetical protein
VGVARNQMREVVVDEVTRGRSRRCTEGARQGPSIDLDESTGLEQARETLRRRLDERVALGMRKNRSDALRSQIFDPLGEGGRPTFIWELEKQELAGTSEREGVQRVVVEAIELLERHLGALHDLDRDAPRVESQTKALQTLLDLRPCRRISSRDMRRRREHAHAGCCEGSSQRQALLERRGAVVEPRQNMGVQVDRPR